MIDKVYILRVCLRKVKKRKKAHNNRDVKMLSHLCPAIKFRKY